MPGVGSALLRVSSLKVCGLSDSHIVETYFLACRRSNIVHAPQI